MNYTKAGFLEAFRCLNSGINTKEANQYLLKLETSSEGWNIALQLLDEQNDQIKLYGATLINKKINQTDSLPSEQVLQFLLSKVTENQHNKPLVNELCSAISKLLVNHKALMQQFVASANHPGNEEIQLRILKEIPASICYNTKSILYQKTETSSLLKRFLPLLIRSWSNNDLVVEVIQNFSQFCRVEMLTCNQLLQRIITLPIERTQSILYDFLMNSNRDNKEVVLRLSGYILKPINDPAISQNRGYITLYIELCRFLIQSPMSLNDFKLILFNMLRFIQPKPDLIMDSIQFWIELTEKFHSEERTLEETVILCEALQTLNARTLELSKLKKLIPHNYKIHTIQLFDEKDEGVPNGFQFDSTKNVQNDENYALDFRQSAQDIFRLAYRIIRKLSQRLDKYYNQLFQLVTKGELELELVLLVLKSIIDSVSTVQEQQYISTIVNMLVDHFDSLPRQILIPFTQLLYESDYIFTTNPQLTQKCLNMFLRMLGAKQVSRLLSQTIQNIVDTVCAQESNTKPLLERFVSIIFQEITNIEDDVVRDNILGALIVLLTHQQNPEQSYRNFLNVLTTKMEGLPPQKQFQIIHSAIFVHQLKINDCSLHQQFGNFIMRIEGTLTSIFENISQKDRARLIFILAKNAPKVGANIPSTLIHLCRVFVSRSFNSNTNINFCIQFLAAITYFYRVDQAGYSELLADILPNIGSMIVTEERTEVLKAYVLLCQTLSEIGYGVDYNLIFEQLRRIMELPFNYQLFKEILRYFIWLARHNIIVQAVMLQTLKHYNRVADVFHQQLMSILIQGYKSGGEVPLMNSLCVVYPKLEPSNPVYSSLVQALNEGDTKTIKNILLCLK